MSIQTINPTTNAAIKSFEEMTDEEVNTTGQISNQHKKSPASSQDKPNNKIEDIEDNEVQEVEPTFQRRPQFRLNENNRRSFY